MCMSMTEGNLINLLTIRNGNLLYVVQNERYASSGVSVLISFARVSGNIRLYLPRGVKVLTVC